MIDLGKWAGGAYRIPTQERPPEASKHRMTHSNHPAQKKTTRTEGFSLQDRLAIAVATGCGAGFMPKAPGTAGAIEGVLIYF